MLKILQLIILNCLEIKEIVIRTVSAKMIFALIASNGFYQIAA